MPKRDNKIHKVHKEVSAKITVYIDEGIKELVEIFNCFEYMTTVSSCEGTEGKLRGHIYIECVYQEAKYSDNAPYSEIKIRSSGLLAELAQRIFSAIHKYQFSDKKNRDYTDDLIGEITLKLEWGADALNDRYFFPTLIFEFPHRRIRELTSIIKKLV